MYAAFETGSSGHNQTCQLLYDLCQLALDIFGNSTSIIKILKLYIILSCTHLPFLSSSYPFHAMHTIMSEIFNRQLTKDKSCGNPVTQASSGKAMYRKDTEHLYHAFVY